MTKRNLNIELMRYLMIIAVAILHLGEDFTARYQEKTLVMLP